LCIGGKRAAVDEFKTALKAEYDVTDHGPVTSYVGIEFTRNREARAGFISMKNGIRKAQDCSLPKCYNCESVRK